MDKLVENAYKACKMNDENFSKAQKFNKKNCEIVMARYNEDISWAYDYKHLLTVYNKGHDNLDISSIKLDNVGRESHTFLYHIVKNYNNLSDTTVFSKA